MRRSGILLAAVAVMAFANPVAAQRQRASPHESTGATIDGAKIEVTYGRPYKKGRQIWGALNPWGKVWRLGADEATIMETSAPLKFGSLSVPAGKHSLYLLPQENGTAKLIVNKQTGQWGTEYDESQDLGRVDLKMEKAEKPVEQLTISIEPEGSGGALRIAWDDRVYVAPFTVAAGRGR